MLGFLLKTWKQLWRDLATNWAFHSVQEWTRIPIVAPVDSTVDYYNGKGWHSIIMQGMVNHVGHFTEINIGWPGKSHDAKLFVNLALYKRGQDESDTLFPDWKMTISGRDPSLFLCWATLPIPSFHGWWKHFLTKEAYRTSKRLLVIDLVKLELLLSINMVGSRDEGGACSSIMTCLFVTCLNL